MQLPRSKRSRSAVPSFGRHDINAPMRVAAAEGRAAQTEVSTSLKKAEFGARLNEGQQKVIDAEHQGASRLQRYKFTMSEADRVHRANTMRNVLGLAKVGIQAYTAYEAVQESAAVAEAGEILTKYKFGTQDAATKVTQTRYRVDKGGIIRDNSDVIVDHFRGATDSLQRIHLDDISDPRVRELVTKGMEQIDTKNFGDMGRVALNWKIDGAAVQAENSISLALAKGDTALAKTLLAENTKAGSIADPIKWQKAINVGESINKFRAGLDAAIDPEAIGQLRAELALDGGDVAYMNLTSAQRTQLEGEIKLKVDNFWAKYGDSLASGGIKTAEAEVRRLAKKSPESMGYETVQQRNSMIGRIKTAISTANYGLEVNKTVAEARGYVQRVAAGELFTKSDTKMMKAYDSYFAMTLEKFADEDGNVPRRFTDNWYFALESVRNGRGVFPKQVGSIVGAAMRSDNPADVANAVKFYQGYKKNAPAALDALNLSKDDKAFMESVALKMEFGTPSEKAIELTKNNIYNVSDIVKAVRVDQLGDLDFEDQMEMMLDEMPEWEEGQVGVDIPWTDMMVPTSLGIDWELNTVTSDEFRAAAFSTFSEYFVKSGDAEAARNNTALDLVNAFAPSVRTGSVVRKDQPEVVYHGELPAQAINDHLEVTLPTLKDHNNKPYNFGVKDITLIAPQNSNPNETPYWFMADPTGKILYDGVKAHEIRFDDTGYVSEETKKANAKRKHLVEENQTIQKAEKLNQQLGGEFYKNPEDVARDTFNHQTNPFYVDPMAIIKRAYERQNQ